MQQQIYYFILFFMVIMNLLTLYYKKLYTIFSTLSSFNGIFQLSLYFL